MLIVVLTGGLGSGKSTAARFFAARGARVIDTDELAARVLAGDGDVRRLLEKEYGRKVLQSDGSIDRAALATAAFGDEESARRLNAIVHPAVAESLRRELDALRAADPPPAVVVIEVPLLVEAPAIAELADRVLALEASPSVRIARTVERGMSESDARSRISKQADDEDRARMANDRIVNEGTESDFTCALAAYWEMLAALEAD